MADWRKLNRIYIFVQDAIKKVLYLFRNLKNSYGKTDKFISRVESGKPTVKYGWMKTIWANMLNLIMLFLTVFAIFLVYYDIPNYPLWVTEEIPTKTYSYIDTRYGNYVSYEVDYTVKYRKLNLSILPPDYDISISLPIEVNGYKEVSEAMGRKIDIWVDAPNDTIKIKNINKVNPLLLHIPYVSEESIDPELIVIETPLPEIQNNSIMGDSFFVKVKNSGRHDIRTLRYHSNVTKWIDVYLIQLKNGAWINQPIMIYDGGLPVQETMIDDKGILTWEINSLNIGEEKVYYFKRLNEPS